jgi:HSP20 family protein
MLATRNNRSRELERFFTNPFETLRSWDPFDYTSRTHLPHFPVDVRQEGDQTIIEAELPGVKKDDLNISIEGNVLTISAESKQEHEENESNFYMKERFQGKVSRSFRLPEEADTNKVDANLQNGVLTLRIPTKETAKPKRIEVK